MIEFRNFSFRYEESGEQTLKNINLKIREGEFLLFTGRSGCGKTTLMRSLNGLIPHFYPGETDGDLLLDDNSLLKMKPAELAGKIGTVFQDPRSQFFMTDTTRELAFGCENMGYEKAETVRRVERAVKNLSLESYLNKSIFALSSGEKQQIAIGSVYAMSPKVFIFDEPSANLDYEATKRLTEIMGHLKKMGITVLVVEHRFFYLKNLIDRAVWIENGTIEKEFTGKEFCSLDENTRVLHGLRTAYPEREIDLIRKQGERKRERGDKECISVKNLSFSYEKGKPILSDICFTAEEGDITGIVGHNGAGKTTLLSIMTGIMKEKSGEIFYGQKKLSEKQRRKLSYLVMQDTDYQLFGSSVEEELTLGIKNVQMDYVTDVLESLELLEYKERHPAALSGGQKQRVTIGAAIMKESHIIYFDEPTSGLDYDSMLRVSELIKTLAEEGAIIFVVSHDFEFITRSCTRILDLDGNMQNVPVTEEILKQLAKKHFS
ncbi:MAG: energy-coupling factor ABC transporter ATP-binding protein [Clostridium sp.]|nr:energy-coupling factor ABC transporter ATP-binding protein [Clostridium sp.]